MTRRRRTRAGRRPGLGLLAAGLALLAGCAGEAPPSGPAAYVAAARASSERAEAAAARGDRGAAIASLRALLAEPVPDALRPGHARALRQDAYARLAGHLLDAGALEAAAEAVREGLTLGRGADVFTANLMVLRGRVLEAKGRDRAAAEAYAEALALHEALLDEALRGASEGGEG